MALNSDLIPPYQQPIRDVNIAGQEAAVDVNIVGGGGSGGTAQADESAFVEGTTSITPVGGVLNETIASDPTEDQAAAVRITSKRAFHSNLRNASGAEIGVLAAPIRTDPVGTTEQPVIVNDIEDGAGDSVMDAANNALRVNVVAGAAGGTEYTEGATDASITGVAALAESPSDVLKPLLVDASQHLQVDIAADSVGIGGGTQYTEDAAAEADPVGNALIMVRDDALSGQTTTDGDNVAARGTDKGELYVKHVDAIPITAASLPLPTGAATSAAQLPDGHAVTVDNASGAAAVNIQDGGNTITVDGTVTANAGTNLNTSALALEAGGNLAGAATSLAVIDDWDESDRAKVNVIAGQAGIAGGTGTDGATVPRVTLATNVALPAGTNALGKLLPPDIDVTAHTNYARKYYTNAGAVTDGIIWSPASGKRWHVTTLIIQVSAAAVVTLEDDLAGGDVVVAKWEFAANSGIAINFPEKYPLASGEDAADLIITTSAGNVYVTAVGYEI